MSQSPRGENESIALIIDTSSSAIAGLDEAREMAQKINLLTGSEQFKLFMLGSAMPISPATLRQASPRGVNQQAQTCSLITPIMETLVREEQKQSVIIIGNGEIFDLDDWTDDARVDGWLLVRTGKESLQATSGKVSEISVDQWDDKIDTLFSYFSRFTRQLAETNRHGYYPGAYKWQVDNSGYPLIFVEPLDAYVHLFPVTKPQFEKFIASGRQPAYGDEWYAELLALNPRSSYRSPDIQVRERLFMTGITTDDAVSFGRWLGRDYKLATAEEWCICYEWFAEQSAPSLPLELAKRLSRDALAIWDIVEVQWLAQHRQTNLQELSLMKQGILEWVVERPGRYCGLGDPASSKLQRRHSDPVRPLGRLKNLGFRLCVRSR
jgi:hypothetical protein